MSERIGARVPLSGSFLVANHAECAERPEQVWIVSRPKRQGACTIAHFGRTLVCAARPNDIASVEQLVSARHQISGASLIHPGSDRQLCVRWRDCDPSLALGGNHAVGP